jgi:hypothetical protein
MSDTQHITHEDHHRALVRRLAAEIKPARRLWPIRARMGLWAALEAGILAWIITHTDNPFMAKLAQPVYSLELFLFTGAALMFAAMALRSAIPGRILGAHSAALGSVFVSAGTLLVIVGEPTRTSEFLGEFLRVGLPCAFRTSAFAALPWLMLWWLVKRGAPMRGQLSGLLVGASALSLSFAMMRIACPIDEPLHLLTWHLLPALMLTALSAIAGTSWLRFRPRPPSSLRPADRATA